MSGEEKKTTHAIETTVDYRFSNENRTKKSELLGSILIVCRQIK